MKFAWPWMLGVAGFVVLFILWLSWASERAARRKLAGVVAPRLRDQLLRTVHYGKRWWKAILFGLGLALACFAIARPQLGFQMVEEERSSVDFLIALDLSRSMLAEDAQNESRLAAAKDGIGKLLDRIGSDRAGLIGFAGEAFLAAPITPDHESVKRNLGALDSNAIAKQGSDMAKAIEFAIKTFEKGKYDTKALVLLTDGEELQGEAVIAAREASRKGISIFTVGVGSAAGARIPERTRDGGIEFARNEFRREVLTRLNERMLQQLAASGRGFYQALGPDRDGLIEVWERGLQPLAKGTQTRPSKDLEEYFQWPLALALALLLWELLVSDRRHHPKESRA